MFLKAFTHIFVKMSFNVFIFCSIYYIVFSFFNLATRNEKKSIIEFAYTSEVFQAYVTVVVNAQSAWTRQCWRDKERLHSGRCQNAIYAQTRHRTTSTCFLQPDDGILQVRDYSKIILTIQPNLIHLMAESDLEKAASISKNNVKNWFTKMYTYKKSVCLLQTGLEV